MDAAKASASRPPLLRPPFSIFAHRPSLIASQLLEIDSTHSQQTTKYFLIASFSAIFHASPPPRTKNPPWQRQSCLCTFGLAQMDIAEAAPCERLGKSEFAITRRGKEEFQPLKYRFCSCNEALPAGTSRGLPFHAPARLHFRSTRHFTSALRFLAARVTPSPSQLAPSRCRPPRLVRLPSPRHSQRIRRNIFRDRGPRRHVRAVANPHRSHQRAITSDKNAIADRRLVLRHAVVVASDRPRADVRFAPHGRIAQISQVPGLRALVHHRIFHFHEISNVRARAYIRPRTQPRERPHVCLVPHATGIQRRVRADDYFIVQAQYRAARSPSESCSARRCASCPAVARTARSPCLPPR